MINTYFENIKVFINTGDLHGDFTGSYDIIAAFRGLKVDAHKKEGLVSLTCFPDSIISVILTANVFIGFNNTLYRR